MKFPTNYKKAAVSFFSEDQNFTFQMPKLSSISNTVFDWVVIIWLFALMLKLSLY